MVRPPPHESPPMTTPSRRDALLQQPVIGRHRVLDRRREGVLRGQPVVEAQHPGVGHAGQVGQRRAVRPHGADHVAAAVQVHDHPVIRDAESGNPLGGDAARSDLLEHRVFGQLKLAGELFVPDPELLDGGEALGLLLARPEHGNCLVQFW